MAPSVLNINVGVLGHVDSGKTTLAKALSTIASTASFDKNPQSQERGITIDLGFSSFCAPLPQHLRSQFDTLQFTLVDCPGHASLIRTIIGGAQIIDLMMLIVDITKGMQTQTAECLVIGEITCNKMIVVLNKLDLIAVEKRKSVIEKMTKKIQKVLEKTTFENVPVVAVAAKPGGTEENSEPIGVKELINLLCEHVFVPKRSAEGPFMFAVDHCFSIRGQGTVMTGTVIQGSVAVNSSVEIPSLKLTKKLKSIQMFRKPVEKAIQGDRIGMCVTQFDPKQLERSIVCTPGHLSLTHAVVAAVEKIPYYKGTCATKAKFHVTILHDTVMAKTTFFGLHEPGADTPKVDVKSLSSLDFQREYTYQSELYSNSSHLKIDKDEENPGSMPSVQFALLEFEKPVILSKKCLLIGSKLDTDIHANVCRLAFYGYVLEIFGTKQIADAVLPTLKVYKTKEKKGFVERMVNDYEVIGRSLFKKETNIQNFVGLKVSLSTGEEGAIEGGFGQSGKVKIRIPVGLKSTTAALLSTNKKKNKETECEQVQIILTFKRYVYDPQKKMIQTS
ncbi:selenocysteine-specific elongation factor [Centruroides vittatus]|uniref:selenocysteine-specific elongation factor n=1 Tax=Centruroides vittatus TaxID=120091 RepID=UPI00350FBAB8